MISDRYYMRANDSAKGLAPLLWLIGALVAGFIVQRTVDSFWPHTTDYWIALTPENIAHGRIWTLVTYSFLHDPENLLHLIANALGILFIGRLLLPTIGTRRFLWTYFGAVLAGGLLWLAVNFFRSSPVFHPSLIGASAGAYGLLALFCCRFAYERMTILLFFIVPLTVIPRYFLMAIGAIETLFFLFAELFPIGAQSSFAHSAHIAGMVAGIIAYRALRNAPPEDDEEEEPAHRAIELPSWMRKKSPSTTPTTALQGNITGRENLKAEVDRILDKINTSGFGSLTAEEKRTLDEARNLMTKR
jgi:membrane associated rhomboid family serine protease